MIAAVVHPPQIQLEAYQLGDYVAPIWDAGLLHRGVVIAIEPKGKQQANWIAKVKWLKGRTEARQTTSTVAFRKLRLVWRPTEGAMVRLKSGERRQGQCEITKVYDSGELQLQPSNGSSFKAGLEVLDIPEQPTNFAERYETEGQAILQGQGLQAGDFVVSLRSIPGCDANAVFKIGMIDDDGVWLQLVGDENISIEPVAWAQLRRATEAELAAVEIEEEPLIEQADGKPTQSSEIESQESIVSAYEYTPINPTPVWFSPNSDAGNIVEGQAIARNGRNLVRVAWGDDRETDVPEQRLQWTNPGAQARAFSGLQSLPLSMITVDPEIQPRVLMDEHAIAEYAEAMAAGVWDWAKDPMIAYWDKETLWLSSGGHRYEAAARAKLSEISLEVRVGDRSEAILNAPCANMQHGVRMSFRDKNRAIALILKDPKWQQESSRALARLLTARGFRVDHKKIEAIRKEMALSGVIPQIEQRTVRRGSQTYTTSAPPVQQDQRTLEELKVLYAVIGEFSINGHPAKPYKFEGGGVLQRFKSLDEAYASFNWMRDRVAEKQKKYVTTCVDCTKRSDLADGEFECSAFGLTHAVTDDPGVNGCRAYRRKNWSQMRPSFDLQPKPAAYAPFNPAIERPEPPASTVVPGDSTKDGEEAAQITGSVVAEQAAARNSLKQAIGKWAFANEDEWCESALENAVEEVIYLLSNFEF